MLLLLLLLTLSLEYFSFASRLRSIENGISRETSSHGSRHQRGIWSPTIASNGRPNDLF
jgi:hypothetical protein